MCKHGGVGTTHSSHAKPVCSFLQFPGEAISLLLLSTCPIRSLEQPVASPQSKGSCGSAPGDFQQPALSPPEDLSAKADLVLQGNVLLLGGFSDHRSSSTAPSPQSADSESGRVHQVSRGASLTDPVGRWEPLSPLPSAEIGTQTYGSSISLADFEMIAACGELMEAFSYRLPGYTL